MPFKDNKGKSYEELGCTICPIGEHLSEDKWQLSGTGFYIHPEGIALSASHNFRDRGIEYTDSDQLFNKKPIKTIGTPAFFRLIPLSDNEIHIEITQIQNVIYLKGIDIAIVLSGISRDPPKKLNLTSKIPNIGERIYAYSYPNESGNTDNITGKIKLDKAEYEGVITNHYLKGRDKVLLPGPCIEAKMEAPGGTSGGPVFNIKGHVFGVISTSLTGDPPIAYITPIFPILNMTFEINTDKGVQKLSLRQLSKMGLISLFE